MARARYFEVVMDTGGRPLPSATVNVYQPGTTTPITETIFAADTGATTLTNPLTANAQGEIEFYLAAPKRVDLRWVKTGYTTESHPADVMNAEHAHSGAYRALADPLFLPATELLGTGGTVLIGNFGVAAGRTAAWMLDATTDEYVSGLYRVPSGWATVNVVAIWANGGAGAGDVVIRLDYRTAGLTDEIVARTTGAPITVTAPVLNFRTTTTLQAALAVDPAKMQTFTIARIGTAVADTLANDIGLLGVSIERAS